MSQTLTYVMGADRRVHVKDIQDFKIDFSDDNHNWVQARQFERGMRQVFVNIVNEDGTPFDLTGCNVWFEGLLPKTADGDFRVIDDDGYVPLDPSAGKFRFDMPGHAFTIAGSYRQAFFRIVKNGNSVTTLEFDLDVLADKVIDGLVPKSWIGPFEKTADQLVDGLKKHTDDADNILADFRKKVGDLIAQLNQQGSTTTSMLTELQNRIADLEEKIKQDGLATEKDLQEFESAIRDEIKKVTESIAAIRQMGRNNAGLLQYKMVSVTGKGAEGKLALTENEANHLSVIGVEVCLVDMVNITSATDYKPQTSDLSYVQQTIDLLKKYNIPVKMIKPHLGVNWSDGFSRAEFVPDDIPTFFENWTKVLLAYAKIAEQNNIPILCVGCEQYHQSENQNVGFWKTLTATIKASYPNLLLTYAFANAEFSDSNHLQLCECLDVIGLNVYPTYVYAGTDESSVTLQDTMASIAYSPAGKQYYKIIDDISSHFHKNIILTEVGVMPLKGGLSKVLVDGYNNHTDINDPAYDYSISALVMETIFNTLAKDKNVIGFSWWHLDQPFQFFNLQTTIDSLSPAEQTFQKYVKGGII